MLLLLTFMIQLCLTIEEQHINAYSTHTGRPAKRDINQADASRMVSVKGQGLRGQ
jgi:hypothetical protein